jgi:hypothetical protein
MDLDARERYHRFAARFFHSGEYAYAQDDNAHVFNLLRSPVYKSRGLFVMIPSTLRR